MTDKEMESAITWLGQTLIATKGKPHIDTVNWARNYLNNIAQELEAQERGSLDSDPDIFLRERR